MCRDTGVAAGRAKASPPRPGRAGSLSAMVMPPGQETPPLSHPERKAGMFYGQYTGNDANKRCLEVAEKGHL